MTAVVVTGGRDHPDWRIAWRALSELDEVTPITKLFHGGAEGWDTYCRMWAHAMNAAGRRIVVRTIRARWKQHGPYKAGPNRNTGMLLQAVRAGATTLVAGKGGNGTRDCMTTARVVFGLTIIKAR